MKFSIETLATYGGTLSRGDEPPENPICVDPKELAMYACNALSNMFEDENQKDPRRKDFVKRKVLTTHAILASESTEKLLNKWRVGHKVLAWMKKIREKARSVRDDGTGQPRVTFGNDNPRARLGVKVDSTTDSASHGESVDHSSAAHGDDFEEFLKRYFPDFRERLNKLLETNVDRRFEQLYDHYFRNENGLNHGGDKFSTPAASLDGEDPENSDILDTRTTPQDEHFGDTVDEESSEVVEKEASEGNDQRKRSRKEHGRNRKVRKFDDP